MSTEAPSGYVALPEVRKVPPVIDPGLKVNVVRIPDLLRCVGISRHL
jgi:hypothetical protein